MHGFLRWSIYLLESVVSSGNGLIGLSPEMDYQESVPIEVLPTAQPDNLPGLCFSDSNQTITSNSSVLTTQLTNSSTSSYSVQNSVNTVSMGIFTTAQADQSPSLYLSDSNNFNTPESSVQTTELPNTLLSSHSSQNPTIESVESSANNSGSLSKLFYIKLYEYFKL